MRDVTKECTKVRIAADVRERMTVANSSLEQDGEVEEQKLVLGQVGHRGHEPWLQRQSQETQMQEKIDQAWQAAAVCPTK